MDEQTPWVVTCEAIKQADEFENRYEVRVVAKLANHHQLDKQISELFKNHGLLFMYSDEPKPVVQYLESAGFYDQQAIELSQQLTPEQPIAFAVVKRISDESVPKTGTDYLVIKHFESIQPLDRQINVLDKKSVPDELEEILFSQELTQTGSNVISSQNDNTESSTLKTYAVIDASKLEVFDGTHFLDDLPRKSLYTGDAARLYKRLAPYLIELEANHEFTRRLFTQAENEQQQAWYFYQQSAGIYIRSYLSFDELFKHLRRFTRIYNPKTETWLQYRFFEPHWLEDMLNCLGAGQLRKFWGSAFDQLICVKPLQESVSVISAKVELDEIKAEKFELTESYDSSLERCKEKKFSRKALLFCREHLGNTEVSIEESVFVSNAVTKAKEFGLYIELAVLYFVSSCWLLAVG